MVSIETAASHLKLRVTDMQGEGAKTIPARQRLISRDRLVALHGLVRPLAYYPWQRLLVNV